MQIQFHQTNQFNHFNNRFINSIYKSNADTSLHTRRRMMESQEQVKETEAVKVAISAEAMELSRQVKAMERKDQAGKRLLQFINTNAEKADETSVPELADETEETVKLTDEDLYEELLNQVKIWGDKSYALLHDYNHQETAEMAEKRAAALTAMQKLEELQKSEISKQVKDAQKTAGQASMQQEEINKKSSELIMMIESFEEQDEENDKAAKGEEDKEDAAESAGSLMEGEFGAMAAKGEMGILDTMNTMDESSTHRIASSDHSIKAAETERRNIYRANDAQNFMIKEKIEEMSYYVSTLANNEEVRESFKVRIKEETDPSARKKLQAMMEYFDGMEMKDEYHDLKRDREYALQERINARDLRIAYLGSRHFVMAGQQEKELQSLFDEDDILRTQGQGGITSRTEDVAERLQEILDERDNVGEDTEPDEDIREKEEQREKELDELTEEKLEKGELGQNEDENKFESKD